MRIVSIVYEKRPTFEAARQEAGDGYQNAALLSDAPTQPYDMSNSNIIDVPVFFGHSMAALGIVAARLGLRKLRVLDVGGALGGHFAAAHTTFGSGLEFDWTVVETPLYADHGRKLIRTPELAFVTSLDEVAEEAFDLAYFSSVFPYVPDVDAVLEAKAVKGAPFLFVSRTGMHDEEINFLQTVTYDVATVRYPGRILSRPAFTERLSRDYDLLTSWQNEQYSVENRAYAAPSMLWRRKG